ncbi:glycosyltransferase family 92 protein Os08g0121900 [Rosa rugosa]|uniref:glycosyltransferase family 92 protein Os08g0121900 n=1 Tax=Rosa rugosa TaxID=74645 RepID=UPI002B400BE5|nr:glycosyltransferase family 92 protein Os08g0121900 [Rosa rugosa]
MTTQNKPHAFPPLLSLQTLTAMRRSLSAALLFAIAALFLFASFSLHLSRSDLIHRYPIPSPAADHHLLRHDDQSPPLSHVSSVSTVAVLLPAWKVLVIVSPETPLSEKDRYVCVFQNNRTSRARFAGILPSRNRTAFYCAMPNRVRRLRPFLQPVLSRKSLIINNDSPGPTTVPEMIRWTFLVYESFSTEDDVVLLAKGLNNRQGVNRPLSEFRCVFGDASKPDAVRTAVTSSNQEVFRCPHPDLTAALNDDANARISLEIVDGNRVIPSVAYYTAPKRRRRTSSSSNAGPTEQPSHELCACTMVYNVAKFLREWVTYHSRIGVDRFILYDNDSDDDLEHVVRQLNQEGFNVTTTFWIWPKTQEAGFSHTAVYAKSLCKWMIYIDVDEFVFAPNSWGESPAPGRHMLKSLIPKDPSIGQVSIHCNEFGPSNQKTHPLEGVTQGYTCRRRFEQRHKSIVLLEAVEHSLLNVIHHFDIKKEFRTKQLSSEDAIVNHYKYQAWPEFQTKFRRRVSAYVVDWTEGLNPMSKDRTPGLGFQPVEPKGWPEMFCEVRDERLKMLTQKWFGSPTSSKMVWQS